MAKKCVLILLDGLGDRACDMFDGRTPLEAAQTPALDELARMGASGLYHAGRPGLALPSENAHFAMFGYGEDEFPGRGPLEALGAGIRLAPGDAAVLAHLVGVKERDHSLVLVKDRAKADPKEAEDLAEAVAEYETRGIRIRFKRIHGLFGVLVLSGEVSPHFTDTNPMTDGVSLFEVLPYASHTGDPAAVNTAAAVKDYLVWAYRVLSGHPVNKARQADGRGTINALVTQRPGMPGSVQPFGQRWGLRGLSIGSGVMYKGLAGYLGMDFTEHPDTGDPGEDLAGRIESARQALLDYDFIHVHTKAPDQAAHTKDPQFKRAVIEVLDEAIGRSIGPLVEDPDVLVVAASDHSTPSTGPLIHSGEPVPLVFCGPGVRVDEVASFDEIAAARGALGPVRGEELMYLVLNYLDLAKLRGIMNTPEDQAFWPGNFKPFKLE